MNGVKRYLFNRMEAAAILIRYISLAVNLYPFVPIVNDGGIAGAFMLVTLNGEYSRFLVLVITIFPAAMVLSEEIFQGYYRTFVYRVGIKSYILTRSLDVFLSAFTIEAAAFFLYFITYMILLPGSFFVGDISMWDSAAKDASSLWQWFVLLVRIVGAFSYCGTFALVMFAAAAWSNNKYVIYSSAFLCENILGMVYQISWRLWFLDPAEKYIASGYSSLYPVWQQILIIAVYKLILAAISLKLILAGLKKRM